MKFQEDRELVQTLLGVNLVVEAGAGTGKTSSLIDRLCVCVLVQNTPIEKIVALTFTEKAAAEIKTRFMMQLQALITAIGTHTKDRTLTLLRENFSVKDDDLVDRAEAALLRLDRASIGTIHGFCAEILKVFALDAGLAPNAQIDEGQQATRLFEARWNAFLDKELGVSAPRGQAWKSVLAEIPLEDLKSFARVLCSGKVENYDYWAKRDILVEVCRKKRDKSRLLAGAYLENPLKLRTVEKQLLLAADSLDRTLLFLERKGVPPVDVPFTYTPLGKPPKGWEENAFEEATSLCQFAGKVAVEKQRLFLAAYELVEPLCVQVRRDFRQAGILSFDDLIIKTRDLLRTNFRVRRFLKEKYDALFIDEFQDTDPVQGELLLFLAEEKTEFATRWQEVKLLPGKLFVVGDPKQSIYRFRGADITAYELFTDLILKQGGKKCFLQCNFRSEPEIIDVANQVCARVMHQEAAFQPQYVPIFTDKTARNGAVEWHFVTKGNTDLTADDFRHNQAEQIARWIDQNVGKMTLANGRKLARKDIAILLRAGTQLSFYTEALRRWGIAFNVETDTDFFRKQEIGDLLNLLKVIANPQDRIALTGVLRSPLGGLTDEELYQLAQKGELSLSAAASNPKAVFCFRLIKQLMHQAGRLSVQELVSRVLEDTFLPEACIAAYGGERSLHYLRQLVKLVEKYATQDDSSAATFFTRLQEKVAQNPDLISVCMGDESVDGVTLLTIHKSKGLEFPVVILADLTKQERSSSAKDSQPIFSWQYNMHGLSVGKICDVNKAFLEEEQKKHSACEEVRILYVALTRAKEKLLLLGDERDGFIKSAAPFMAAGVFPDLETQTPLLQVDNLTIPVYYSHGQRPDAFRFAQHTPCVSHEKLPDPIAWKQSFEQRSKQYEKWIKQSRMQTPSALEETTLISEQQRAGAQLGTICHRALELLLTNPKLSAQEACRQAASQCAAPERTEETLQLIEPFVQSVLFTQLKACEILACEMPFSYLSKEGQLTSGLIDVLAKRPDGMLWIVDYKTDRILPGQEVPTLVQKYQGQLNAYKEAISQLFAGEKIICSAVFIRTFASAEL